MHHKLKIQTPREKESSMKHNFLWVVEVKKNIQLYVTTIWYLSPKMFTHVNAAAALLNPITFRHCSDIIHSAIDFLLVKVGSPEQKVLL